MNLEVNAIISKLGITTPDSHVLYLLPSRYGCDTIITPLLKSNMASSHQQFEEGTPLCPEMDISDDLSLIFVVKRFTGVLPSLQSSRALYVGCKLREAKRVVKVLELETDKRGKQSRS